MTGDQASLKQLLVDFLSLLHNPSLGDLISVLETEIEGPLGVTLEFENPPDRKHTCVRWETSLGRLHSLGGL